MINVGIIGGAGYTAGELLRILLKHPETEITCVQSSSNAGNLLTEVHTDLLGDTTMKFSSDIDMDNIDVLFLCMGHGRSREYIESHDIRSTVKIIDLSHDYRINHQGNEFIYGLPELNREKIRMAGKVANPGCFATGIQLALLPLAAGNLILDDIHVNAITGSTGAGQRPTETSHFSWRSGNISAYKIFEHQHEAEILQSLKQLQYELPGNMWFMPVRGNHTRGIFVTAYTRYQGSLEQAEELFKNYYSGHPFVVISDKNPSLKQVINTNKGILYLEKHKDILVIISLTDNLIKGASGQAVQNMNLMFGIEETAGLLLKPVAF